MGLIFNLISATTCLTHPTQARSSNASTWLSANQRALLSTSTWAAYVYCRTDKKTHGTRSSSGRCWSTVLSKSLNYLLVPPKSAGPQAPIFHVSVICKARDAVALGPMIDPSNIALLSYLRGDYTGGWPFTTKTNDRPAKTLVQVPRA